MRSLPACASLATSVLLAAVAPRAHAEPPAAVAGRWVATVDLWGTPQYYQLELTQQGETLGGTFSGDKLEGSLHGATVQFLAKDSDGGSEEATATLAGTTLTGTLVLTDSGDPRHPTRHSFTASFVPPRTARPPHRHDFTPTVFYRQFSPLNAPVLRIAPGDTVSTTTVDAGGSDARGTVRVLGGNPQTGPFFVEGAVPGDTLVVHLDRVRLNRDWAISDDALVPRALDSRLAVSHKDTHQSVRWHLDRARGIATSEKPGAHLARYTVPLRPMLGCIGVAPSPVQAPPPTGDSGPWGGNMDFNEAVEGATVYLPVRNPGALLYLGDGHAAQGDGELTGDALETSLDVQFTVDILPGQTLLGPRLESASHLMAMGLDGSLDGAFRAATANMAAWLADAYKLTPSEVAQILGTAAEYRISEVADRNAGIVLKLARDRLRPLLPGK